MNDTVTLRLTLDVTYTTNGTPIDRLKEILEDLGSLSMGQDRFVQETHAEVQRVQAEVVEIRPVSDVSSLVELAEERKISPEDLDDFVHGAAADLASAVNSGGLDDQIVYLIERDGYERTRKLLESLVPETRHEAG